MHQNPINIKHRNHQAYYTSIKQKIGDKLLLLRPTYKAIYSIRTWKRSTPEQRLYRSRKIFIKVVQKACFHSSSQNCLNEISYSEVSSYFSSLSADHFPKETRLEKKINLKYDWNIQKIRWNQKIYRKFFAKMMKLKKK